MGDVVRKFLNPLQEIFPLPKVESVEGFIKAYEGVLESFSDETLAEAARHIIETRGTRSFPLPAECNHACHDAIATLRARKNIGEKTDNKLEINNATLEERYPECSEKRRKEADLNFARCEYARQSVEEDWSWTLWDWINLHRRSPDVHEARKIREKGMENSRYFWESIGHPDKVDTGTVVSGLVRKLIGMREKATNRLRELAR